MIGDLYQKKAKAITLFEFQISSSERLTNKLIENWTKMGYEPKLFDSTFDVARCINGNHYPTIIFTGTDNTMPFSLAPKNNIATEGSKVSIQDILQFGHIRYTVKSNNITVIQTYQQHKNDIHDCYDVYKFLGNYFWNEYNPVKAEDAIREWLFFPEPNLQDDEE